MDYNSFSHGPIQSKIWLCEQLEPYVPDRAIVAIVGSWYNVLGFMMLTRNANKYQSILGIDIDSSTLEIAGKINQGWMIGEEVKLNNIIADANTFNFQGFNLVINCSPEHMDSNQWFNNIQSGTLVCLQSSNIDSADDVWKISNPNRTLEEFVQKYPLSHYMLITTKEITYDDWGYSRFMIIGVK